MQFVNRCDEDELDAQDLASSLCNQPTEVWDVRTLQRDLLVKHIAIDARVARPAGGQPTSTLHNLQTSQNFLHRLRNMSRPWAHLDEPRRQCELSRDWQMCMACRGSVIERACAMKCTKPRRGHPSTLSPDLEGSVAYGSSRIQGHYHLWMQAAQHPLAKAMAWSPYWSSVLRHFYNASTHACGAVQLVNASGGGGGGGTSCDCLSPRPER